MPDFMGRLATARDYVSPQWTAEREVRVRVGMERRRRSRARTRATLAVTAVSTALVAVALFFALRGPFAEHPVASPVAPAPKLVQPSNLFELPDGSSVSARSSAARVQPVEVSGRAVTLKLESGAAKFSVTPDPARPFRVLARNVTVTVLGTVFDVAFEGNGVRVSVEQGRVRVDVGTTSRVLVPGQTELFVDTLAAPLVPPSAAAPAAPAPPSVAPGPSWRALAEDGDYSAALARLTLEGPSAVRDTPNELLLAADVARLGGQPARAVAPLERVVSRHAGDSRAPLAAFTLGRTLLDQLGRPREAANAFAQVRRLAPSGALAQDALAREVESWSRAGDTAKAHARAVEYLKLYPHDRRAASVRRFGGIEE